MPSLEQLEEFKSSFKDVANEALIMGKNQLPMENVELPDTAPPSPFPEGLERPPDTGTPGLPDLNQDLPPPDFSGFDTEGDFGLSDLIGTEDILSGSGEVPGGEPGGMPEDLLSGFAEDLETGGLPANDDAGGRAGPAGTENETPAGTDFSGFDLPEFPDIDLSQAVDMGSEDRTAPLNIETGEPGFGADAGFGADDFGAGDLGAGDFGQGEAAEPGIELGTELPGGADFGGADLGAGAGFGDADAGFGDADAGFGAGDFGVPDFGQGEATEPGIELGTELPGGAEIGGADFGADAGFGAGADLGGADLGADAGFGDVDAGSFGAGAGFGGAEIGDADLNLPDLEDEGAAGDVSSSGPEFTNDNLGPLGPEELISSEGGSADSFDSFSPTGMDWQASKEEAPDFSAQDDFGDFSLPGFDDTLTGPAPRTRPQAAGSAVPGGSDDIEEIRLSEEEYGRLQDTLSAYPLNLRIACEELISEQAVAPDLMSALVKLLTRGAPAKETASLAGKILGRNIPIPKGYIKQTGEELEAEQGSFGYIFVHSFLPILRFFGAIALVVLSMAYLSWRFIITPWQAEKLYKQGYETLQAGEYIRANELFRQGFEKYRMKKWFYRYAEGFRDERQYIYAERKYDELLRAYPRDKKGALDYAALESNYIKNYEKADRIIRTNILDYAVNDREGLIALAENNLAWAATDPSRYEEARAAYARLLERYGRQDPFLEGMLKYFIRTDKLNEVLPLQAYFMENPKKRKISVPALAELGGYLLDKRFGEEEGVPDEYIGQIDGIRDVLLRAINADGTYPESYYHLARYYNRYGSTSEERQSLEQAIRIFDGAPEENSKRVAYRIDSHRRYAEVLINAREFFPAEEEFIRGLRIYEDARARQVLKTDGEFGRLYTGLGDLEFFAKDGNMEAALRFYQEGERNGWAPPEIQYRMGAAHYQLEQWEEALQRFFALSPFMPNNKRLLYALGNVSYLRGNYFAAQGYYNRLMDLLDAERVRFPNLMPGSRPEEMDLAERIMVTDNNLGVTLEALTRISGDTSYRTRALGLFSESIRAWDVLTRNPETMTRMRPFKDLYGPGINLAYLNAQNIQRPSPNYEQQIFMRIDRDVLEFSTWENLIPRDYRLSDQIQGTE
ncbi:MAG: tetratricopeptide repeat protein [Spirochaetaceae bacterium]|jgi:tetratricopeptide (TPR) repeat protein|nr:tetratricopeptide repeat protein [Spirochaetaceae bacterium]